MFDVCVYLSLRGLAEVLLFIKNSGCCTGPAVLLNLSVFLGPGAPRGKTV